MIRWHPWCSARARCCAIFACCGRFALISCQELASGGETFGSRPVPFGTCSAAYTSYSCTPVLHDPEQEIELVLDNPRSAHRCDRTFLIEIFFISAAPKFLQAAHHEQLQRNSSSLQTARVRPGESGIDAIDISTWPNPNASTAHRQQ